MRISDVLLQVDSYPDPTPDAAIDAAVAFTAAVGAKLSALGVHVDIPLVRSRLADRMIDLGALEREWEAASLAACRAAMAHFEAQARAAGVFEGSEILRINLLEVEERVARRARTRDLLLVPLGAGGDSQRSLAQEAIFQSGRPVLAYSTARPILSGDRLSDVVVAWDGSRSAARALADALPLLRIAGSVRVVTFIHEKASATTGLGVEVLRHLAAHGVSATAEEVSAVGVRIGEALDAYLSAAPAEILVMGAYGHARLLEFVLGGATAHVLDRLPTAVFLSH